MTSVIIQFHLVIFLLFSFPFVLLWCYFHGDKFYGRRVYLTMQASSVESERHFQLQET
jgi:hypothetical protein